MHNALAPALEPAPAPLHFILHNEHCTLHTAHLSLQTEQKENLLNLKIMCHVSPVTFHMSHVKCNWANSMKTYEIIFENLHFFKNLTVCIFFLITTKIQLLKIPNRT